MAEVGFQKSYSCASDDGSGSERAREQLEREKGEKLEAKHQKSFADPEANMMKTEGSFAVLLQRAAGDE